MLDVNQMNVDQLALLLLAAALVVLVFVFLNHTKKQTSSRPYKFESGDRKPSLAQHSNLNMVDYSQQLMAVESSSFERQQIMNRTEYRVFKVLETEVASAKKGYRVFVQIPLGEILKAQQEIARRSINSKRVDAVVVDRAGWPIVAIECQGSGHYQNNAAARDAVKREALRKAGVRYLEVFPDQSDEQIRSHLREHLEYAAGEKSGSNQAVDVSVFETST